MHLVSTCIQQGGRELDNIARLQESGVRQDIDDRSFDGRHLIQPVGTEGIAVLTGRYAQYQKNSTIDDQESPLRGE